FSAPTAPRQRVRSPSFAVTERSPSPLIWKSIESVTGFAPPTSTHRSDFPRLHTHVLRPSLSRLNHPSPVPTHTEAPARFPAASSFGAGCLASARMTAKDA